MSINADRGDAPRPEVVAGISYGPALPETIAKEDPLENEQNTFTCPSPPKEATLFCASSLKIAIPNFLIPTLYGYHIGFVGPYATLYSYATNCQLYGAQASCETLSGAKCQWMDASTVNASSSLGMVCGWKAPHTTCFLKYDTEAGCDGDSDCVWNYPTGTCGNKVGYTSMMSGLFAGSMIMGCLVGALAGGYLTKWLDYRRSFLVIGIFCFVSSVLTHVSTGIFQYWLLFVARIIVGVAMGWQSIAAPHYTNKFAPPTLQKTMGVLFQVFGAFGGLVAAVFAICLGNTIKFNSDSNQNLMGRMQGFVSVTTLMSILVMLLPLVTKDGYSMVQGDNYEEHAEEAPGAKAQLKRYPFSKMIKPVLVGMTMGCTLQLTGINANMNFAPTIMANLGLDALVGNLIVMGWNGVTAFGVIPLSKKFSMRTLFLACTLIGSLCCLFLSGIPVYPGVTKVKMAKDAVAIIGIAVFIASFEMGIGPCFYVLAMDVFPESFRPIGSSITTGVMFICNLVINICYPIATEGMSGGPSGNQDKGQAIAFIFFGCAGLITFVIEYFFLVPWEDETDASSEQLEAAAAEMK